ncbi:hypothetical protein H5410_050150, partial [Solanum commersonii]
QVPGCRWGLWLLAPFEVTGEIRGGVEVLGILDGFVLQIGSGLIGESG